MIKSKEEGQDNAATESNNEEEDTEDDNEVKSIYAIEEAKKYIFPTLLDLLSIDNDVVREMLIDKCNIDKMMVVPQFEKFLEYLPQLQEAGNKTVVGCDADGKVVSIDPNTFRGFSDSIMTMGYIEAPTSVFNNPEKVLEVWAAKDIRDRWPEFAKHLADGDKCQNIGEASTSQNFNPMVVYHQESSSSSDVKESSTDTKDVNDIMASLAARGISIQKK